MAFIAAAIGPQLRTNSIAHSIKPLACVLSAVTKGVGTLCHTTILINLLIGCSRGLRHSFTQHAATFAWIIRVIFATYLREVSWLIRLLTISVLKVNVLMLTVDHVLLIERLADLAIFVLSLSIAVAGAVTHCY